MEKKTSPSNGMLKVSNEVIMKIVELAASEINGVASENGRLAVYQSFTGALGSPVRVSVSKETVVIDLSIITEQGSKAINVASAVQESVKSAVQSMTGIAVSKVNVNIVGIMLNKEE